MAKSPDTPRLLRDRSSEPQASILLVDDNPANLLSLRALLEGLGQNLVEARSGEEALQRIPANEFAVVLLDVLMPGMSGFETAKAIRGQDRSHHTPIIFLTAGDVDRAQMEEGYALGAVDFLVKPLSPVALQAKVRGLVELFKEKQQAQHEADQLRLLVQGTTEYAIFMLDPQGLVVTWNAGAERFKGYKAAEIIGQHFSRFYPQDAIDRGWPAHELKVATIEGRFEDEGWRIRKDGSRFWANVVITALYDEAGTFRGFSKITRDLTERRRSEENARRLLEEAAARQLAEETSRLVREQRERLHVTLSSIGDAVISTDTEGRVDFLNPVAEELVGWRNHEATSRHLSEVFHIVNEETRQPVDNPALQALRDGRIVGLANHTILISRSGRERAIDDSAAPIRDGDGNVIGCVLVFRDISERKQSEERLRASEERKSAVLKTALDCIITMDHEGTIVEFNPAAERTFGYHREEIVGKELCQLIIPPALRERHRQGMAHYFATGEGPVLGKRLKLPAMRSDGSEFPAELTITRISSVGPPLFTAYLRDITDEKHAEQYRNVRLACTQALSESVGVEEAARTLIEAVCENLGWQLGFFWTVNGDALHCRQSWCSAQAQGSRFESASCSRTFAKGEGLPGRAWSSGRPTWILDVLQDANFPRTAFAAQDGLHSAFATPIIVGEQTIGVIEFFTHRFREPEAELLEMMGTIAGHLGQFMERNRFEADLRQSEGRFRGLMEQAPFSIQVFSPDGRTIRVNRAWEELWGVTFEQVADYNILKDGQLEAKGVLPLIRQAFAGEPSHIPAIQYDPNETFPHRTRYQDARRWVAAVAYPLKDAAGRVQEVVLVHDDITSRQKADADLRESERRLRLALEAGRMGVWDWNIRTNEINWSESLEPLHGLAPGTFDGTFEGFQRLIHPADRELVSSAIQQALAAGTGYDIEFRNIWPNGSVHWIAGKGMVFPDTTGQPERMIGIGMDVTHRKRSEQSARFLADASASLAVLVDFESTLQKVASLAVPHFADWAAVDLVEADGSLRRVAVCHVDPSKIALAHEVHRRFPPDPAAPQGAWNILRTGVAEMVSEITDELLAQSVKDEELLGIMRELGLKSYIGVPLKVRGRTLGVITFITAELGHLYEAADLAVAQDLADRGAIAVENTRLYRELRDADRRKDEFLATLAHELRNPLAPIRNSLQILKLPRVDEATVQLTRDMMERQVHHLVRLVDDLLDVSRVMRGKIELRKEPVELSTIVARAVETATPLIEVQGHQLNVSVAHDSLLLDADAVRLAQVVGNLLTNAAKYSEVHGHIWLTAWREGEQAVLSVRDTGIGIAPDMLPHVFELFVQADHTSTKAHGGLGIGLTLVKNLVEMHNGLVEARSAGLGQGSEFIVRLPLLTQTPITGDSEPIAQGSAALSSAVVTPMIFAASVEPIAQGSAALSSGHRLLVVDDNHDAAISLSMLLRLQGHEVRVSHNGTSALEIAAVFRPDLIFLDIGMPGMDGYEVARRIRKTPGLEHTILAALTGWGQQEDRRRTAEAGFDHHLVKPPEPKAVEGVLAAMKSSHL